MATDLKSLIKSISENPSSISDFSEDDLLAAKEKIDLYNVLDDNEKFVNMSVINWKEEYIRKFTTTALIAYTGRLAMEYPGKGEDATYKVAIEDQREIIGDFLKHNFDFNPDRHVRTAHKTTLVTSDIRKFIQNPKPVAVENLYSEARSALCGAYAGMLESAKHLASSIATIASTESQLAELGVNTSALKDAHGILLKKYAEISQQLNTHAGDFKNLSQAETIEAFKYSPSADMFSHFDRYVINNYEELRDCTEAMYSAKPDIEFCIICYPQFFDTPDEAREWRIAHEKEFKFDVLTLSTRGANLLGPFKENRERVDFFNKNTEIVKSMMDQHEADSKIGKALLDKRVKNKKRENIEKYGPDSKALANYASVAGNDMGTMGAKKIVSYEEQLEIAKEIEDKRKAKAIALQDKETLDKSLLVEVFSTEVNDDGTGKMVKSSFQTESVAPQLNVDQQLEAQVEAKKPKKMIVDKFGNKRSIDSFIASKKL